MNIPAKIRMAEAYANISEADLARRLGTTPQAFSQRMKTGKFSSEDLENIAAALGAEIKVTIKFSDGTEI